MFAHKSGKQGAHDLAYEISRADADKATEEERVCDWRLCMRRECGNATSAYMVLEDVLGEQSSSSLADEASSASAKGGSRGACFWLVELDGVIPVLL